MEILFASCLLFALGYVARDFFGDCTGSGDREEHEQPALPPPTERVPMLPPSVRVDAIVPVYHGGPYRTQDEHEDEDLSQLPAHNYISFQNFFRYCQANGMPECPADDVDFVNVAREVGFGEARELADLLAQEILSRFKKDEDEPVLIEQLTMSQALIQAVAVRNCTLDADLLVETLQLTTWSEARYVLLRAIGGVWPVSPRVILAVAKMQEYRQANALASTEAITGTAKEIIGRWRKRDPEGYRDLSRQLLRDV